MLNPYRLLYDCRMDLFRFEHAEDAEGFSKRVPMPVANNVMCRYSSPPAAVPAKPAPKLSSEGTLFCDLDVPIAEGDRAVVHFKNGSEIVLHVGEVRPYSMQFQCSVRREAMA